MTRPPVNELGPLRPRMDPEQVKALTGDRRRAGLRCAEYALQGAQEWEAAREDLRRLLDMLGLNETGETR